jgi:hypothetical protein
MSTTSRTGRQILKRGAPQRFIHPITPGTGIVKQSLVWSVEGTEKKKAHPDRIQMKLIYGKKDIKHQYWILQDAVTTQQSIGLLSCLVE